MKIRPGLNIFFGLLSVAVFIAIGAFLRPGVSAWEGILVISVFVFLNLYVIIKKSENLILLLSGIYTLYFILEFITYALICGEVIRPDFYSVYGGNFGATNRPYVKFDSISGYKYVPGETRLVNIFNRQIVYDHALHANNRGYCSLIDFPYQKRNKSVKRLMVFGDSYSAGEITDTTWVDLLNQRLLRDTVQPVELFNFSLEASGISIWNNIFFKEILPRYDFDGVVLAVFGDVSYYSSDLARPFVIKHSFADRSSFNFFDSLPKNNDDFVLNYEPRLLYESSIYATDEINRYELLIRGEKGTAREFSWKKPRPYFLNLLAESVDFIRKRYTFRQNFSARAIEKGDKECLFNDLQSFNNYYGKRSKLTTAILDYCIANHKEIYLISVPSFNVVWEDRSNYHNNIYNRQLRSLASKYQAHFFDGYSMLDSVPESHYDRLHLYQDSHWNRKGIDLFLNSMPKDFFKQHL